MTWPSVDAPASAPADHGEVRTQAYYAGGGDYFRSGYYYHGVFGSVAAGTMALTVDSMLLRPFVLPVRRAFDALAVRVSTAGASSQVRLGLYADGGGVATDLIVDAGTVSGATTGHKSAAIAVDLEPGIVWVATVGQVAACNIGAFSTNQHVPFHSVTVAIASGVIGGFAYAVSGVSGALPSVVPSLPTDGVFQPPPLCMLRAA